MSNEELEKEVERLTKERDKATRDFDSIVRKGTLGWYDDMYRQLEAMEAARNDANAELATLRTTTQDHGSAIEAAAENIEGISNLPDGCEPLRRYLRSLVATVTNSQQKGREPFGGPATVITERKPTPLTEAELGELKSRASAPTSDQGAATLDRETLGKMVRKVWIDWAKEQPTPKASWLVEWDGLSEPDKEVDRRIGETLANLRTNNPITQP